MFKKIAYGLLVLVIIVSLLVTSGLSYLLFTNYDNLGRLIKTYTLIKAQALEPISNDELILGAMEGMINALEDPYSVYLDEATYENLQERMRGTYGGVGLLITKDKDGKLVVVSPFRGTPAHREGIVSGDLITKINGQSTDEMDLEMAASLMQGEPGTDVVIITFRENRGEKEIKITREVITIPSVDGSIITEAPDIAYISLTMFNENTASELSRFLMELKGEGYKGLVLDLRNNPGGNLNAAVEVADFFIPEGPVVHIVSKYGSNSFKAAGPPINVPMVVLVNSGSASASEIVAGAIQDTGVGILVGEKTFGKGLVQTIFPIGEKAALKLTTAKYLTPNKQDINEKGIEPDVEVIVTPEELMNALIEAPNPKDDPQLQKAIELLRQKIQ